MASSMQLSTPQARSQYVGYVSDPNGRGTASLVISCLLTLLLCVWSALHLNVPNLDRGLRGRLFLNLRWIVAGIYLPEMVVFVAWRQWSSARLLSKEIESLRANSELKYLSQTLQGPSQWTMTHSFFACSGGFAFEIDALDAILPHVSDNERARPKRLTITARGMKMLAQLGMLPAIERDEIEDKSKANNLAKAAVIIQAAWMFLQVLARLEADLPVTLLEVNTVAHVACTFIMYIFWWHKPLLPSVPVLLRSEDLAPIAAFMFTSSEMSGKINRENLKSQTTIKTFFAQLNIFSSMPEIERLCYQKDLRLPSLYSHRTGLCKAPESCRGLMEEQREKAQGAAFFERRPRVLGDDGEKSNKVDVIEKQRWNLIESAWRQHPSIFQDCVNYVHKMDGIECLHLRSEQLVSTHVRNWPSDDLLRDVDGLVVGMVLWLANFCYGAFHLAAWNSHFPSEVEQLLWRVSSSYIGFCGGLWVILNWLVSRFATLNLFWEKWMEGAKGPAQSFVLGVVVFLCGLSLMLARVYVVLEAFASIRQLPDSAYDTPQWTNIFPHF